jgi:signal transduction histidine kinase
MPILFVILALVSCLCFLLGLYASERHKLAVLHRQDRAINTMLSLLSHRLRTPLTSVKWYAELLLNQDLGKLTFAQMESLHKMQTAVDDSIGILNAFLETSQVERASVMYSPVVIDVEQQLQHVVRNAENRLKEKKQRLIFDPPDRRVLGYVNPLAFQVMFEVLISNAINYTPAQGTIYLSVAARDNDVRIDVRDTGIGMTSEEQRRLFGHMFRSERSRAMHASGKGVGLYLVKEMLGQLGGTITCASTEGEGTTFTVTLPGATRSQAL